jgi:hypothetical protein
MTSQDLTIRRASADELDAIVDVAGSALGWAPGEPHAELFVWKHMHNAFGESPMWVAVAPDGRLAGFRTLMQGGNLAQTGSDSFPLAKLGGGLIGAGALFVILAARRRQSAIQV